MPKKAKKKNDSSRRDNETSKSNEEDALAARKAKLREQIEDLRSVILEVETNLDISRFKDVTADSAQENTEQLTTKATRLWNVDATLENELRRLAGLSCVAFEKDYCTFNLSPGGSSDRENEYAVQILINGEVGGLGNWVMPMFVDMTKLASEIPLTDLRNTPTFLRACKHFVDCHFARQRQYQELMKTVLELKRCGLQKNPGYTRITLELFGVQDLEEDTPKDIVVYLMYNPEEARPYSVKVDTKERKELDEETEKILKSSLKCFKYLDLSTAFKKILNDDRKRFRWEREIDEDSLLNLDNLSNSDEEEEERRRKNKNKTPVRKKKERERLPSTLREREKSALPRGAQSSSANRTISREAQEVPALELETPLHREKGKLRQTKLRFHLDNTESSLPSDIESQSKEPERATKRPKLLTSTPLSHPRGEPILSTSFDFSDGPGGGSKRKAPSKASPINKKTTSRTAKKGSPGRKRVRRKKGA